MTKTKPIQKIEVERRIEGEWHLFFVLRIWLQKRCKGDAG
jgi:hypothetical protein